MEKGTDKIKIDGGDFFDGTRNMFRDCFFDNATNEQIIDFCKVEGVSVVIKQNDTILYISPKSTDLKETDDSITIEELRKLKSFGEEQDGSFCDRWEFSIIPIKDKKDNIVKYSFCLFNEVNGHNTRVRYITSMKQLHDLYKVITDKELS